MAKIKDQDVSNAFMQKVLADTRMQAVQQDNMQMMLQSLHMTAAKDAFVALYAKCEFEPSPDMLDAIAIRARNAADRLMVALGATVKREPAA